MLALAKNLGEPHELLLKEVLEYARNNLALIDVMIQGPYITSHECHYLLPIWQMLHKGQLIL